MRQGEEMEKGEIKYRELARTLEMEIRGGFYLLGAVFVVAALRVSRRP